MDVSSPSANPDQGADCWGDKGECYLLFRILGVLSYLMKGGAAIGFLTKIRNRQSYKKRCMVLVRENGD